jgi:hypothetical protein
VRRIFPKRNTKVSCPYLRTQLPEMDGQLPPRADKAGKRFHSWRIEISRVLSTM